MDRERELSRIYADAGRAVRDILFRVDLSSFDAERMSRVTHLARFIVDDLDVRAARWTRETIAETSAKTKKKTRVALEILGRHPIHPKTNTLGRENVERLVLGFLLKANASIMTTVEKYLQMGLLAANRLHRSQIQEFSAFDMEPDLSEWLDEAIKFDKTRGWIQSKIMDYMRDLITDDNLIEINGKMWRVARYAEMVARTTLREAATQETLDLCKEYNNDLVQVSDHQTICEICAPLEGNVYSLSGSSAAYPQLPDETPFHPNCKHSILPTSEEAITAREEREQRQ